MNEQQLAAVKLALETLKAISFHGDVAVVVTPEREFVLTEAITTLQSIIAQDALDKKAENARELGLSYDDEPKIGCVNHDCDKCKAVQEPVALDVYVKHDQIYFSIGNQSFPIDYTPEDEPECSAGQAADWYMGQLRHALQRLSNTTPPAAQRQWVGLTHEEVDSWELPDCPTVFEFAQFIEAKLKEKNGGAA